VGAFGGGDYVCSPSSPTRTGQHTHTTPLTTLATLTALSHPHVPPSHTCDRRSAAVERVLHAYKAMTSPEERSVLLAKPRDINHANGIARRLTQLLVERILNAYHDSNIEAPPSFKSTGVHIYINTLTQNLVDSKLLVDSRAFASWRESYVANGGWQSTAHDSKPTPPDRKRRRGCYSESDSEEDSGADEGHGEGDGQSQESAVVL
jgi:hypothetical protein